MKGEKTPRCREDRREEGPYIYGDGLRKENEEEQMYQQD